MLTAPELDRYISRYDKRSVADERDRFSEKSWKKIKELYEILDKIEPSGQDNEHVLYFKLPRGKIRDYGKYEDYLACGEVENEKIVDFVHLDYENEAEMSRLVDWKEIEKVYLK